ncbi:phosphatidylethanolamine-binding protein 4-like [Galleria mellonella]|uniref:Phosphatidylethanolamine-binding protein 4-like n=1 Tax=Galleria mellonella TaxID=7137 RepID=A0A6J1W920_GALME|nr:phosphatidylethanolamine-binding protein 4-like [Galleria mellonella]
MIIWFHKIVLVFLISYFYGVSLQCSVTDTKSLLEGCDRLMGLNVTSVGGTMVNDHNCDVLLPKQVFMEEPLFQYPLADTKKFYSIIMVDPDAPPQVEGEFYLHMLKSNIPGLALKAEESSKTVGIDYRGYKAPTPPRGTGTHRYMSLLYEQADGNNFLPFVPTSRNRFVLAKWLRGKNLCGPVAAIQFRSQF